MPKATFIDCDGIATDVTVERGWTLMEGARAANLDGIVAECGGSCACATCHVLVDDEWLDKLAPASQSELDMLTCTAAPADRNSRLSCQIVMLENLDGIVLHLPETQI